jgi:hypothetical protein
MRRAVGVPAICAATVVCLAACAPPIAPPPSAPLPTAPLPPRAALGFLSPVTPGQESFKVRRTVTHVQVNACNGESVELAGELREETKVKDSRVDQRLKANLKGTGSLGNQYEFKLDIQSKWDTTTMTMTLKDRELLASKGDVPDQRVTVTITSSPLSFELESECHGGPKR